jgi:hypothetical protein
MRHRRRLSAGLTDRLCHGFGAGTVPIGDIDECAFLGEALSGRAAETRNRCTTGDQCDLAFKSSHEILLKIGRGHF